MLRLCSVLLAMRSEESWLDTIGYGWSRGFGRTNDIVGGRCQAVCVVTSALLRHLPVLPVLLVVVPSTELAPGRRSLEIITPDRAESCIPPAKSSDFGLRVLVPETRTVAIYSYM